MPVAVMNQTQTLLNIAIMDDLDTDRAKLADAIREYSFHAKTDCAITTYRSGEELLEAFSPGMFDLAFLDIQMEGMSGIELAKALRALDTKLMIVFLTSSREYAFDAFPVHPFDYLVKPFEQDALVALLTEALRVMETPEPLHRADKTVSQRATDSCRSRSFPDICLLLGASDRPTGWGDG